MPLAFPSHQGLIIPLARRWPRRFAVLPLCVGAAMPDVVDGLLGLYRGHLGQWYGHTLVGSVVFCLPGGLVLTWLLARSADRLARRRGPVRRWCSSLARLAHPGEARDDSPQTGFLRRGLILSSWSIWIGAFSHLFWDFISHGNFWWLYPWIENSRVFPSWWYAAWFDIPLPFYTDPYPFGPHLVVWIALTILGAAVFFRPLWRKDQGTSR